MKPAFVPLKFTEYPREEMISRSRRFHAEMSRRRTVRHFSDRTIPREVVETAIRTAATAPSGAHKQPWRFVLIEDAEIKGRIREAAEEEERRSYEERMPPAWIQDLEPLGTDWSKPFLTTCPYLIAVFAETFALTEQGPAKHYYVQESVGIATGLLIAALHHAGVATLTHTPSPMKFLREILGRPRNERPFLLLAIGYPESGCEVPNLVRKPLEEILAVR